MPASVSVHQRAVERARWGHPWIYRTDVVDVDAEGGDVVRVAGPRGRTLGYATFSDRSRIALRFLTHGDSAPSPDLWRDRIARAVAFRTALRIDATAYRLVQAEADLLPGLIVDRYGDVLVVQTLTQATDRRRSELVGALVELCGPAGVLARNDPKVRALEGLERVVEVVQGDVPDLVSVREGDVSYDVDLRHGQKTGLFLDQRENRLAALAYAHGRALDAFSYHGGFALTLAPHCAEVVAVESSADAAATIGANAARNGRTNIRVEMANAFDYLREAERRREPFDLVVLDPPAFAKSRAAVEKAAAGYKEINLRALKLLPQNGVLVTCSCSQHVDEARFAQILFEAALDAHATVTVVDKRMQARDHPVLLGMPESYYLKCFILRRIA